jgi:hypothetical protein
MRIRSCLTPQKPRSSQDLSTRSQAKTAKRISGNQ